MRKHSIWLVRSLPRSVWRHVVCSCVRASERVVRGLGLGRGEVQVTILSLAINQARPMEVAYCSEMSV